MLLKLISLQYPALQVRSTVTHPTSQWPASPLFEGWFGVFFPNIWKTRSSPEQEALQEEDCPGATPTSHPSEGQVLPWVSNPTCFKISYA